MLEQGDKTGIYVLSRGEDAFLVREWMVTNARESFDMTTFIWTLDEIGTVFTQGLLSAAEQGIRVRLLLDDYTLWDKPRENLLALDAHPCIEVKIYNPLISTGVSFFELVYNSLFKFKAMNQRLHNKTMLMDGLVGITGGRNIANAYFRYDLEMRYLDRDVMILGSAVEAMDLNFQNFWNSSLAKPISELMQGQKEKLARGSFSPFYKHLDHSGRKLRRQIPLVREVTSKTDSRFREILDDVQWTSARFISDSPKKHSSNPADESEVAQAVSRMITEATERITIESPYFVVPDSLLEDLCLSRKKGVSVRVITNSLASTDNVLSFSGYESQRDEFLKMGLELRELKAHPSFQSEDNANNGQQMVLHAKTIVVDGRRLFIGTFNIDPRSFYLNTEEGVLIEDPVLARQVETRIEWLMKEGNSWDPAEMNTEAQAGLWRRFKLWIYGLLPVKALL